MKEIVIQTLFGGIVGGGVVAAILAFLLQKGRLIALLRSNLLNPETLSELMNQVEWKQELTPLIDEQLDALTESIKQKNAMIRMFLTPSIADPLKAEGKARILEMIPSVKEKLARKLSNEEIGEKLEIYVKKWIKQKMLPFVGCAFLLGAFFGLIGGLLIAYF